MQKLLIFGATSLARLAHSYATASGRFETVGFVVDAAYKTDDRFLSHPVYVWEEACRQFPAGQVEFFVAVGYKNMRLRSLAYQRIKSAGYSLNNIVHDASSVSDDVVMGDNNIVMPGVVIEPGVVLGSNNVIWSNATICHDSTVGDHNFIAANVTVGGEVTIGNNNFLGFSTTVIQQTCIGDETLIAAQSLVTHNTESLCEYRGIPAKKHAVLSADAGIQV